MVSLQGNLHQTSHYEPEILDNSFRYIQSRKLFLVSSLDVLSLLPYRLRLQIQRYLNECPATYA